MITDEGRVKVADFEVAYIESSSLTKTGAHIGTPAYMSMFAGLTPRCERIISGTCDSVNLTARTCREGNTDADMPLVSLQGVRLAVAIIFRVFRGGGLASVERLLKPLRQDQWRQVRTPG